MASIGHLVTGALVGAVYARATDSRPLPAMAAFAALAAAPDLDLLAIPFDAHGTALEHRVMTHALPFAALVSVVVALAVGQRPHRLLIGVVSFLALASHGVLDAFTRHGAGPALWWPFSQARYAFPWQPIRGSESFAGYFSWQAIPTLLGEAVMFLPVVALIALILTRRRPILGRGRDRGDGGGQRVVPGTAGPPVSHRKASLVVAPSAATSDCHCLHRGLPTTTRSASDSVARPGAVAAPIGSSFE